MPHDQSQRTTDHQTIMEWAKERNGFPARVRGTGEDDPASGGVLRIDFQGGDESLERITWEDFFSVFDARNLEFLYQEKTADGETSRFFKFVSPE